LKNLLTKIAEKSWQKKHLLYIKPLYKNYEKIYHISNSRNLNDFAASNGCKW
jgi:hypothetical protein